MRGDRRIGLWLMLWPILWALWLAADGFPPWSLLVLFLLGAWLMRAAGSVLSDHADHAQGLPVRGSRIGPLASGEVTSRQAVTTLVALVASTLVLALLTNLLTIGLGVGGVLLLLAFPLVRRLTHLYQAYLGVAFSWGILMAFAAVQGELSPLAWLLFCANVLWATGFCTWRAMADREVDREAGSKSIALLFGDLDLVAQGAMFGLFLIAMVLVGLRTELSAAYFDALALAVAMVIFQFWIARRREREVCLKALVQNHWLGLVIFLGIVAGQWMRAA